MNEHLRVTLQDNGPGIAPDVLPKLCQPFFTTKPKGRGTGLGLSVSADIIKDHGGRIWAERPKDQGARFIIDLPIAPAV